jgi:hypothetical protein
MTGNELLELLKALPQEERDLELYHCDSLRYLPVEKLKVTLVDEYGVEVDQGHSVEGNVTRVLAF